MKTQSGKGITEEQVAHAIAILSDDAIQNALKSIVRSAVKEDFGAVRSAVKEDFGAVREDIKASEKRLSKLLAK